MSKLRDFPKELGARRTRFLSTKNENNKKDEYGEKNNEKTINLGLGDGTKATHSRLQVGYSYWGSVVGNRTTAQYSLRSVVGLPGHKFLHHISSLRVVPIPLTLQR